MRYSFHLKPVNGKMDLFVGKLVKSLLEPTSIKCYSTVPPVEI